jgi:hypothetical protein
VADEFKFLLADGALAVAEPNHSIELPPWFDWDKFRRYVRKKSWSSPGIATMIINTMNVSMASVSAWWRNNNNKITTITKMVDRLCGLVVRVLGYRSGSPGSIPGTTRKKVVGLERGALSLVSTTEELLDRKVAAPV